MLIKGGAMILKRNVHSHFKTSNQALSNHISYNSETHSYI